VDRFADKFVEASETVQAGVVYVSSTVPPKPYFAHNANLISTDRFHSGGLLFQGQRRVRPDLPRFLIKTPFTSTPSVSKIRRIRKKLQPL
jgi:hypothetical protein